MKPFRPDRRLRRVVSLRSQDPAVPPSDWALSFDPEGVTIRKLRSKRKPVRLTWRSVICHAIMIGEVAEKEITS